MSQEDLNDKLEVAVRGSNLELVKSLINKGADIHIDDDKPLRLASRYGHLAIMKYLISKGADVAAFDSQALWWAEYNGETENVNYLKAMTLKGKRLKELAKV